MGGAGLAAARALAEGTEAAVPEGEDLGAAEWETGAVRAYLRQVLRLEERGEETLGKAGASAAGVEDLEGYVELVRKLADQVRRRVLEGEQIPQLEKIDSAFEPHTRWCWKGKVGQAVELGVLVMVMESPQQFVLNWRAVVSTRGMRAGPSWPCWRSIWSGTGCR